MPSSIPGLVLDYDASLAAYTQKDGSDLVSQLDIRGVAPENLLLRSAELTNVAWTPTRSSYSGGILTEDGTASQTHLIAQGSLSIKSGVRYRIMARVKYKERHVSIRFDAAAGFSAGYAHFNLQTGAVHSVTGSVGNASISADTDGYYIISAEETASASSANAIPTLNLASAPGTVGYSGDTTSGAYISWVQFQRTLSTPIYTPTVASTIPSVVLDATGTARPTWTASAINGRAALRYGSSTIGMAGAANTATGAFTAMAVYSVDAAVLADAHIFGNGYTGHFQLTQYNNTAYFYVGSGTNYTSRAALAASPHLVTATWDGTTNAASMNLYVDGAGPTAFQSTVAPSSSAVMYLGNRSALDLAPTGYIARAILFNRVLSSAERGRVESYLKSFYGIA